MYSLFLVRSNLHISKPDCKKKIIVTLTDYKFFFNLEISIQRVVDLPFGKILQYQLLRNDEKFISHEDGLNYFSIDFLVGK